MRRRYFKQSLFFALVTLSAGLLLFSLGGLLVYIFLNGFRAVTWDFLTLPPMDSMTKGGILPAILGTLYLTLGAVAVALPLGIVSAIYLTEYARQGKIVRVIRIGVNCLAGVPSVVFGLFGLGFFVVFLGFGSCILSGALTLGILILPTIIGATEEALKAVPQTFREASLALGVSKWLTIWKVVLPSALPGILTGSILGIGRAAGRRRRSCSRRRLFTRRSCPDPYLTKSWHCPIIFTFWPRRAPSSTRPGPSSMERFWCWSVLSWGSICLRS